MIGDVLKRTRAIYGYKATEMSSMLGISNSYLSEIENNKKQPSLEILQNYSKILGIKLSSLILLAEDFEEASKNNKSQEFIKNMMLRLVNFMSKSEGLSDEEPTEET
ncbi:helix-turn-helix domain-containing protein [Paenibacillus sp. FSL K6-2524]|uniref:helix-turn-helix domain-containing protein n=1 Tax=Paenibacillus sp. FSL K6-2524 TaxID=2954516 RepID=UPI0030F99B5B